MENMRNKKTKLKTIFLAILFLGIFGLAGRAWAAECDNRQTLHPDWIVCDDFDDGSYVGWSDWGFSMCRYCDASRTCPGDPATDCEGFHSGQFVSAPYSMRLTVEQGENDGGYPQILGLNRPNNEWTYVRFYEKFDSGYEFTFQTKGQFFAFPSGKNIKLMERGTGENAKFTFHYYDNNCPAADCKIDTMNRGTPVKPMDLVGDWHLYEFAVNPSLCAVKLWIDEELKMDYAGNEVISETSGNGLPGACFGDENISWAQFSMYYGAGAYVAPKTQSLYLDNIVISSDYIGPFATSDTTPLSAPTGLEVQ